jgi:ATP-dependent DNA helicase 2 subunit 2
MRDSECQLSRVKRYQLISSIDIDGLFDDDDGGEEISKAGPSDAKVQSDSSMPRPNAGDDEEVERAASNKKATPAKPKRGRLISNDNPVDDFNRLILGDGDVFRKAIQDLGAVVKENIEDSFSKQGFPLAMECLALMRDTALTWEETDTYNT